MAAAASAAATAAVQITDAELEIRVRNIRALAESHELVSAPALFPLTSPSADQLNQLTLPLPSSCSHGSTSSGASWPCCGRRHR